MILTILLVSATLLWLFVRWPQYTLLHVIKSQFSNELLVKEDRTTNFDKLRGKQRKKHTTYIKDIGSRIWKVEEPSRENPGGDRRRFVPINPDSNMSKLLDFMLDQWKLSGGHKNG